MTLYNCLIKEQMEGEKKKNKYAEKPIQKIKYVEKKSENYLENNQRTQSKDKLTFKQQTILNFLEKPQQQKTTVINVKVQNLRKMGHKSLVDWLSNPNHVYVGRHNHYVPGAIASIWQNPFKVNQFGRDECIQRFKEYLLKNEKLMSQIYTLKGKVLGCWCAPENCHGFVLAEIADTIKE